MQMGMSGGQAPPMEKRSPKDTRKIIARLSNFVFRWKKILQYSLSQSFLP